LLDVLTAAAAIASAAGIAEGTYWWVKQRWQHELTCLHPGYFWMAPIFLLSILAVPALVLAVIACRRPTANVVPFAVTLFALVGWLNLLLLWAPSLHIYSSILAACGLAAVTGRMFQKFPKACIVAARCVLLTAFLIVGISGGIRSKLWQQERRTPALAASPQVPPPPAGAANVLLIVLDAVRAQSLETYGANREVAPNLTVLAGQGVTFEHAWATAPWTLPSQAGMFTGRLPSELSADWLAALDRSEPTLAEELTKRGWATGGFVGNTHYCSAETGLARGFAHYEDYRLTLADIALCTALGRRLLLSSLAADCGLHDWPARKRANEVTRGLVEWLDKRGDRPYFAFVNYFDAHDPYLAPDGYREAVPKSREEVLLLRHWWSARKESLTPEQVELMQRSYEDCIRGLDSSMGKMLTELARRGDLENTIIIITADHGEHFGDHGLYLHGNSLYEPLLHVPLVVVWPNRIPAGVRVKTPVSLSGLPNTVLALVGQEAVFPGKNWAPYWTTDRHDEAIWAEIPSQARYPPCHGHSPVAHGSMQTLRDGNLKYIRGGDGAEELFDLAQDPHELTNLVADPAHRAVAERLRGLWQQRYGSAAEHCEH
jgi:arylsulfatase A-like enzyme